MKGYTKIAALMSQYPESAIVKRFSDLNIQNILYLQAELVGLQQDLRRCEAENETSRDVEKEQLLLDWYTLSSTRDGEEDNEQWQLALRIREKLKEYDEAVVRYSQMLSLQEPGEYELRNLQEWFRRPTMGAVYLTGRDRDVWKDGVDLVALKSAERHYPFVSWLNGLTPTFHRIFGKYYKHPDPTTADFAPNTVYYTDSKISSFAALIGAVIASLLPVLAIVVLYFVTEMGKRLGLVAAFTAVFSICLWFLTEGRLIEVFSATAAFSAVQVVFISTNTPTG
ncbi:hypothetical protein NA57DRAFT_45802 [Rhizodiscina lignyota]|uniref:DUF6594 domain-containing protein n=1 Tax=Rhizodiscina lignyota TaxID=1504668 RepID=A0A9P4M1K4_9PEZI|nr:hypothetical protein NA57DRAFT_45802 [Rhizodiscina lignyota]